MLADNDEFRFGKSIGRLGVHMTSTHRWTSIYVPNDAITTGIVWLVVRRQIDRPLSPSRYFARAIHVLLRRFQQTKGAKKGLYLS